jgi:hypothetical protein
MRARPIAGIVLALAVLAGAACGSDSKSASQRVCDARKDLSGAVAKVSDDVKAGNFGAAKDGLAEVTSAFSDLTTAYSKLSDQQRSDLQQQVDKLKTDARALTDATDKEQLSSALDTVKADLDGLLSSIGKDLSCD